MPKVGVKEEVDGTRHLISMLLFDMGKPVSP
jgi:hypothetical protein